MQTVMPQTSYMTDFHKAKCFSHHNLPCDGNKQSMLSLSKHPSTLEAFRVQAQAQALNK